MNPLLVPLLPVNIASPLNLKRLILSSALLLQLSDKRNDVLAKRLNLLLIVQEARQHEVNTETLEQDNALGNLLLGTNKLGLEPVIVLHQVLERAGRPHALLVARARTGILDLLLEGLDGLDIGFPLDFLQGADGLLLGVADNDKGVDGELDHVLAAKLLGALLDVGDLRPEPLQVHAVHKVPVRHLGAVVLGVVRVAALEDLRVRVGDGLGRKLVVAEPVEVAREGEAFVFWRRPDPSQALHELV